MLFCSDHTLLIEISSSGIGGIGEEMGVGGWLITENQWNEISSENFDSPFIVYKKALTASCSG